MLFIRAQEGLGIVVSDTAYAHWTDNRGGSSAFLWGVGFAGRFVF